MDDFAFKVFLGIRALQFQEIQDVRVFENVVVTNDLVWRFLLFNSDQLPGVFRERDALEKSGLDLPSQFTGGPTKICRLLEIKPPALRVRLSHQQHVMGPANVMVFGEIDFDASGRFPRRCLGNFGGLLGQSSRCLELADCGQFPRQCPGNYKGLEKPPRIPKVSGRKTAAILVCEILCQTLNQLGAIPGALNVFLNVLGDDSPDVPVEGDQLKVCSGRDAVVAMTR